MKLKLIRTNLQPHYTEGALYVDDHFFCYIIEDKVRAKAGFWNRLLKRYGETAIPYGRYEVKVTWSPKFNRMLTEILGVPDFTGIRMHNGTSAASSAGCPIMSRKRIGPGLVLNEKISMDTLCNCILAIQHKEKIFIDIE